MPGAVPVPGGMPGFRVFLVPPLCSCAPGFLTRPPLDEGFVLAAGRELGRFIFLYQAAIASVTVDRGCTDGRRSAFGSLQPRPALPSC